MARKPTEQQVAAVFSEYLDSQGVADLLGTVSAATVRSYSLRKLCPPPAYYVGRTPLWSREMILEWSCNRRGQGVGGGRPRGSGKKKVPVE